MNVAVQTMDAIREGRNSFSKKDIHLKTGIPWGTVCRAVDDLTAKGFIFARKEEPAGRGRPMIPLCIDSEAACFMGIDVGASRAKLLVCDLSLKSLGQDCVSTPRYRDGKLFFDWLSKLFDDAVEKFKIDKRKLRGLGLSVSGNVDAEKGVIVSGGNFGMKWGANLPVEKLAERCGVDVCALTSISAAAYGEYQFGLKAGCDDLLTVNLGVGIGSGVVSGGRLLISRPDRRIGYIGHILMPDNPRVCVCGFKGCLESYSGGSALAAIASEKRLGVSSASDLDALAKAGDAAAKEMLLKAASYNAVGIASMIQIYSPAEIVFSGGQCRKDGFLYSHTLKTLKELLPEERRRSFSVSLSSLGEYQSALGALRLAYEKFL